MPFFVKEDKNWARNYTNPLSRHLPDIARMAEPVRVMIIDQRKK